MYCWEAANSLAICWFSAWAKLSAAMLSLSCSECARSLALRPTTPAKPGLARVGVERTRAQPRLGAVGVVARGSDVVGGVRMKERGQVLDLPPAGPQLPLAAAVGADSVRLAVVIAGKQLAQRAEARGLDVDHPRRPGQALDVGDRVDDRVPGDPLRDGLEDRAGLLVDVGVFEPRVGEGLDQLAVELGVGVDVDRSALVLALEVERVDRARLDQL